MPGTKERYFRFKQFGVSHAQSSMPVGTDTILLGSWTDLTGSNNILEVGTGSGTISLMVAQRSENHTHIEAIDIHEGSCLEASQNAQNSPWRSKIKITLCSFQEFMPENHGVYDLIICNPPFFSNSSPSPLLERNLARHGNTLSFQDLVVHSTRLLKEGGRLSVILPAWEYPAFKKNCLTKSLYPCRITYVHGKSGKPAKRVLAEFTYLTNTTEISETTFYHHEENGEWTEEYVRLTRDFHIV